MKDNLFLPFLKQLVNPSSAKNEFWVILYPHQLVLLSWKALSSSPSVDIPVSVLPAIGVKGVVLICFILAITNDKNCHEKYDLN